jgi:dTDP-4-amino-4,6-dideoxygalactose transaminase
MSRIYLSPPHMGPAERELLLAAFDSNWIAPLGPHVDAFERELCERVGMPHGAALSSGTAGLHLALIMLGVQPGDEVVVSTLTFAATANAVRYVGATPVFIDCDRETWTMDPDLLEEELRGKRAKAVIAVDLYGQCANYGRIVEICERHGVPLIEDAAEGLGATCNGKSAGSFGKCAVFSFNGNKIITTSGGGMLVSRDEKFVQRARYLATQAREPAPHYEHTTVGYNYRLSNLLAAVGRGQLRALDERVAQRRANNAFYREVFRDVPGITFMPEAPYGTCTFWLTCVQVRPEAFGATREDIRVALEKLDIEARPVWKPMHLQPVFSECRARGGRIAAELFEYGLCLPSGSSLSYADRARVADAVVACRR